MTLDATLASLFGGAPEDIHVSHLDHLACTLTPAHVEQLLRCGGPRWTAILDRIAERRAHLAAAKDPGADVRLKEAK
jgi:hypothetical protein